MIDAPAASVIIPTHNRADSIVRSVQSLFEQHAQSSFEIIVVDNASTDDTSSVVQRLIPAAPVNLRVISEGTLGLHRARHAGARAARAELLLFTDDDATFSTGWVEAYVSAFRMHSDMAAAGGPIEPAWDAEPPRWLVDYMHGKDEFPILSLRAAVDTFRLEPDGYFYGVNMAIRKQVLFECGGFNLDSFGPIWLGDGETGLNRKIWAHHELVGWVPNAAVRHHIPAARMTVQYFRRRLKYEGVCDIYALYRGRRPRYVELVLDVLRTVKHGWKPWLRALAVWIRTDRTALDKQLEAAQYWGRLGYLFRLATSYQMRRLVEQTDWLTDTTAT